MTQDIIYLQVDNSENDGEITWCIDRIHDTDITYIKTDTVDELLEFIAAVAQIQGPLQVRARALLTKTEAECDNW